VEPSAPETSTEALVWSTDAETEVSGTGAGASTSGVEGGELPATEASNTAGSIAERLPTDPRSPANKGSVHVNQSSQFCGFIPTGAGKATESGGAAAPASTSPPSSGSSGAGAPKKSRGGEVGVWGRSSDSRNCPTGPFGFTSSHPPEELATKIWGTYASGDERSATSRSTQGAANGGGVTHAGEQRTCLRFAAFPRAGVLGASRRPSEEGSCTAAVTASPETGDDTETGDGEGSSLSGASPREAPD